MSKSTPENAVKKSIKQLLDVLQLSIPDPNEVDLG